MAISQDSTPLNKEGSPKKKLRVAVIGAGAAGLVAARELLREGHVVEVFEQGPDVGGVWLYDERTESDPLGLDPSREAVHSSMYASLRTNLPRECMSYLDFPFTTLPGSTDTDLYCRHETVLLYLQEFAEVFDILSHVRFSTRVEKVIPEQLPRRRGHSVDVRSEDAEALPSSHGSSDSSSLGARQELAAELDGRGASEKLKEDRESSNESSAGMEIQWTRWLVETSTVARSDFISQADTGVENCEEASSPASGARQEGSDGVEGSRNNKTDVYDAVVVCIGQYSQPKIATIPGIKVWPGQQLHSHNYRRPEGFEGLVVVAIGAASSGQDIAREIAGTAREVHLCSREWTAENVPGGPSKMYKNLWSRPMVAGVHADGRVEFGDGSSVRADVIVHCTGYQYHYPFLQGIEPWFRVEDGRVGPLYEHIFPPQLAPTLSFVGIPRQVVPFPLMEAQSKWIAKVLSGEVTLPSCAEMEAEIRSFHERMEAKGLPQRYTHVMGPMAVVGQFDYVDQILARCGLPLLDRWRREIYTAASMNKRTNPDTYRDQWSEPAVLEAARASQAKFAEAQLQRLGRHERSKAVAVSPALAA